MTCEIIFGRTNGKIDKTKVNAVKAPNGKRSLLYDDLKAIVQDDLAALDHYYVTQTDQFKKWFGNGNVDGNGEPTLLDGVYMNEVGEPMEAITEIKPVFKQPKMTDVDNRSEEEKGTVLANTYLYKLSQQLIEYLKPFGIDFKALERLERKGYNARYIADTLNKAIAYDKNDADAVTDASGHLLVELIGRKSPLISTIISKVKSGRWFRTESKTDTFYDGTKDVTVTVSKTVNFWENLKKDFATNLDYLDSKGNVDEDKLGVHAAGLVIAEALKRNSTVEPSLLRDIVKAVADVIKKLFDSLTGGKLGFATYSLDELTDYVAANVLTNNKEFMNAEIPEGKKLMTWEDTIKNSDILSYVHGKLGSHYGLAGSTAFRKYGTTYRPHNEYVHDIDYNVPPDKIDSLDAVVKKAFPSAILAHERWEGKDADTIAYIVPIGDGVEIVGHDKQPRGSMSTDGKQDFVLTNIKLNKPEGKYIAVDFFLSKNKERMSGTGETAWQKAFDAKLTEYGRDKDLLDYRLWKPYGNAPAHIYHDEIFVGANGKSMPIVKHENSSIAQNIRHLIPKLTQAKIDELYSNYKALFEGNKNRVATPMTESQFDFMLRNTQVFNYKNTYIFGNYDAETGVFVTRVNSSPSAKELLAEALPEIAKNYDVISFVPIDVATKYARSGYIPSKESFPFNFRGEEMNKYALFSNDTVALRVFGKSGEEVTGEELAQFNKELMERTDLNPYVNSESNVQLTPESSIVTLATTLKDDKIQFDISDEVRADVSSKVLEEMMYNVKRAKIKLNESLINLNHLESLTVIRDTDEHAESISNGKKEVTKYEKAYETAKNDFDTSAVMTLIKRLSEKYKVEGYFLDSGLAELAYTVLFGQMTADEVREVAALAGIAIDDAPLVTWEPQYSPVSINMDAMREAASNGDYSTEQVAGNELYLSNIAPLAGETMDVKVTELPKNMQYLSKKGDWVTLYKLKEPDTFGRNYLLYRVSMLQDKEYIKNKTQEEIRKGEDSAFSKLSRAGGTAMHKMNEDVLNFLIDEVGALDVTEDKTAYLDRVMAQFKASEAYKKLHLDLIGGKTIMRHEVKYSDDMFFDEDNESYAQTDAVATWEKLAYSMMSLYRQAFEVQAEINAEKGTHYKPFFIIEAPIVDMAASQGGTMDMIVRYSDGSAGIYDHKFINHKKEKKTAAQLQLDVNNDADMDKLYAMRKSQGLSITRNEKNNWTYVIDDKFAQALQFKEKSYSGQIGRYAEMLTKLYGVTFIRQARILPIVVGYKTDKVGVNAAGKDVYDYTENSKVQFVMTGFDNPDVKQIPISVERTGSKKLDEFIDKLTERKKKLQDEMQAKRLWKDEEYQMRLRNLSNTIAGLLVKRDMMSVVSAANNVSRKLGKYRSNNTLPMKDEDIHSYIAELEVYSSFVRLSSDELDKLKRSNKAEGEKLQSEINNMNGEIEYALIYLRDKMVSNLEENYTGADTEDNIDKMKSIGSKAMFESYAEQSDINGISKHLMHLRNINNPLVQQLSANLDQVNVNTIKAMQALQHEVEKNTKALTAWGATKGLKGTDIFKELIDANGDLISVWDRNAYVNELMKRRENLTDENLEWFKANFKRSKVRIGGKKSDEMIFEERKEKIKQYYLELIAADGLPAKALEHMMEKWSMDNDIEYADGNNRAWANRSLWFGREGGFTPNNPAAFHSPEYKNLLRSENKPLLDYYNFYQDAIERLSKLKNIDFRNSITHNFIPNITRDMIDTLAQFGGEGAKGMFSKQWTAIKELMRVKDEEDGMMRVGETKDKTVPIMWIDRIEKDAKSFDLSKSLMLFANFMHRYDGIKSIEHIAKSIAFVVANTDLIQTTALGSKAMKDGSFVKVSGSNSNLRAVVDTMINYYVYGEKDQTTASEAGKKLIQLADKARGLVAHKNLAFNALSATAGHLNAEFQLNMLAVKGNLFDRKTLSNARTETARALREAKNKTENFNSKSVFAYYFFEISQEDMSHERANEVSPSSLRKMFAKDGTMFMQRWSDNSIESTTLTAMMMTFAIDPIDGKAYSIDKLKDMYKNDDKYKNLEWKSLWDSIEMDEKGQKGDGVGTVVSTDTVAKPVIRNQHTGEAMTDRTFTSFRNKVRNTVSNVKGNMSSEDIAGYKTHVISRILGQYRGWIPAMGLERLKKPGFNMTMEEFEVGRWIGTWHMFSAGGAKAAGAFLKQVMPFMSSDFKYAESSPAMKAKYQQWLADNPAHDITRPGVDTASAVSYEQFFKAYVGQTKAMAKELQTYLVCLLALYALMFGLGDDEVEENPLWRSLTGFLDRTKLELGFFIPVAGSGEQLQLVTRSPFAVVQLVTDAYATLSNTAQESWDVISGTPWDMTSTPVIGDDAWTLDFSNRKDNSPLFKHTSEWIPGVKQINNLMGWFDTSKKEDTVWEWLNPAANER